MLSIRSNIASSNAQKNMTSVSNNLQKSMERLSSGFRINRAGDDAAGLAISEKLKAQVGGLMQAARNSGDGISMIQTAEGGMEEIQNMLQRMRELAVAASNDTLGTSERMNIAQELDALRNEAHNVADRTKFNGIGLLAGQLVGRQDTSTAAADLTAGDVLATGNNATVTSIDVSGASAGRTYQFTAGKAAGTLVLTDTTTGASQQLTIATTGGSAQTTTLNYSDLGIKITLNTVLVKTGAEFVTDLTAAATDTIVTLAGGGAAALQSGANKGDTTSVTFADVRMGSGGTNTQMTDVFDDIGTFATAGGANATQTNASNLIDTLDTALNYLSTERAKLGAAQNRLEYSISSVKSQAGNLEASNSRIRDVDVAAESGAMARSNVLMQAGVSVLSQANQIPQLALKLLG